MKSTEPTAGDPARVAPHPVLDEYYGSEEERPGFVRRIFDRTAGDYDRVERLLALGSGSWYRRRALARAGLGPGMRVLDVAIGTGLVAREAAALVGDPSAVTGVDLSLGMLRSARVPPGVQRVQGPAERLPFRSGAFDFVSMGFALRHVADLDAIFPEFLRVLAPGGTVAILEITRPEGRIRRGLLRAYMRGVAPVASRLVARDAETPKLMRYYWDTIESCVPPDRVLASLRRAGFEEPRRLVELGIFSEYIARRPGGSSSRMPGHGERG